MSDEQTPVSELGYEQARDELIEVVRILEAGGQDLDASLALWERGEELAERCTEHLDAGGDPVARPGANAYRRPGAITAGTARRASTARAAARRPVRRRRVTRSRTSARSR